MPSLAWRAVDTRRYTKQIGRLALSDRFTTTNIVMLSQLHKTSARNFAPRGRLELAHPPDGASFVAQPSSGRSVRAQRSRERPRTKRGVTSLTFVSLVRR